MTAAAEPLPPMIVLAGGLGTRLRDRIGPDIPKILAPVHGHAFLDYLLAWCSGQRLQYVHFALGHHAEAVVARLRAVEDRLPFAISWSVESEPRGTAGALALALAGSGDRPADRPCLVMNGDTLVDVALPTFRDAFTGTGARVGMVAAPVPDASRFGTLILDGEDRVLNFAEKRIPAGSNVGGWINAGIYLFSPEICTRVAMLARGSLEHDLLAILPPGTIWAFRQARRFIDIGTDESLDEAHRLLVPNPDRGATGMVWR